MESCFILLAFTGLFFNLQYDHWRHCQWFGVSAVMALLLLPFKRRYGIVPFACLVISIFYSMYLLHFADPAFATLRWRVGNFVGMGIIVMFVWPLVISRPEQWKSWILTSVGYVGFINAVFMLSHATADPDYGWHGLMNNGAADGALVASCYPILAWRPRLKPLGWLRWLEIFSLRLIPLIAILGTRQTTPIAALGAGFLVYLWVSGRRNLVFASSLFFIAVSYFLLGDSMIDSRGRIHAWESTLYLIKTNPDRIPMGFGTGSFETLLPFYETAHGAKSVFIWAHNEWIQVLFEQGIIGLVGLIWMAGRCVKNSLRNPWLLGSVVAILVSTLTQFCFRYLPFQILILCVIMLAEKERDAWKKSA